MNQVGFSIESDPFETGTSFEGSIPDTKHSMGMNRSSFPNLDRMEPDRSKGSIEASLLHRDSWKRSRHLERLRPRHAPFNVSTLTENYSRYKDPKRSIFGRGIGRSLLSIPVSATGAERPRGRRPRRQASSILFVRSIFYCFVSLLRASHEALERISQTFPPIGSHRLYGSRVRDRSHVDLGFDPKPRIGDRFERNRFSNRNRIE